MNWHDVGMNIKQARKKKHLKQKDLANLIGFSESSISKYEQGLIQIPNTVIERIAKVLEVPLCELLPWDEDYNSDNKLANETRVFDTVKSLFGADVVEVLSAYLQLNKEGKKQACEYLVFLTTQEKYCINKESSSAATDNDSNNENTIK